MSSKRKDTQSHRIMLYISELAALLGENRYKSKDVAFIDVFARYQPAQYQQAKQKSGYATTQDVAKKAIESTPKWQQELKSIAQLIPKQNASLVSEAVDKMKLDIQRVSQQKIVEMETKTQEQLARPTLTPSEKQQIKNQVETEIEQVKQETSAVIHDVAGQINTQFGVRHEEAAAQDRSKETKKPAKRDAKTCAFQSMEYNDEATHVLWGIGGKVDGIEYDKEKTRIVEIKNRMRQLFYKIPLYEQIQAQGYIQLLGAEICDIEQRLYLGQASKSKCTPIYRNDKQWQIWWEQLRQMAIALYHFCHVDQYDLKQVEFLQLKAEQRLQWLEQWIEQVKDQPIQEDEQTLEHVQKKRKTE